MKIDNQNNPTSINSTVTTATSASTGQDTPILKSISISSFSLSDISL